MNRQFRTISAFMRSIWLIEPVFAEAHIPYIEAYLAGKLPLKQISDEEQQDGADSDPLAGVGYAVTALRADNNATPQKGYSLDDPELPDGSIFVMDIRGAIFKESTCCSTGTEDYCRLLNQAYATEKIIGIVCLIDSPGGQLSGTPTLYDAIRNPSKPTVSVINEGLMASAAYWLACGSDDIYATQKTDQVGSIGVFVQFEDRSEQRKTQGIKLNTVYSDRSAQKNKPFRDAMAGDDTLLRDDLNQAADLFREAVEQGRGARLKPAAKNGPDVFEGGLFYASKAIELGLIDGFGNLQTALDRVTELHQARQSNSAPAPSGAGHARPSSAVSQAPASQPVATTQPAATQTDTTITEAPTGASTDAPDLSATTPEPVPTAPSVTTIESSTLNPNEPMFGFTKLPALAALKGVAAADVTEAQINAVNAELTAEGYNLAVISQSQFEAAGSLQTQLNTANGTIKTQGEEITRLGKQPGALGSKVEVSRETIAPLDATANPFHSEADAELARIKGKKN